MNDLETQLRDMLRERAHDVTTLPTRLTDPARLDGDAPQSPQSPRHPKLWLVAASVVAVLAIAAGAIVIGRSRHTSTPPAGSHTPSTSVSPSTPAPHVNRLLDPRRVALSVPSDYRVIAWSARTYYGQVSLRPVGETGAPTGNGGTTATAFVTVIDEGRFDGYDPSWTPTTFDGEPAYLGKAKVLGGGSAKASTFSFTSKAGRTVLVQGTTSRTSTEKALRRLAAAVRPDAHDTDQSGSAFPVPFRLTRIHAGLGLVSIEDERSIGYPLVVELEGGSVHVELQVKAGTTFDGLSPSASKRTIAGRPGMVDTAQGKAQVRVTDTMILEVSGYTSRRTTDIPAPALVEQILSGLKIVNTDLDTAIP